MEDMQKVAKTNNYGWLIAASIIGGIVLACAILPLGGFALLLGSAGSASSTLATPSSSWSEQTVEGSGLDRIVIIDIAGTIGAGGGGLLSGGLTQEDILSQIKQASEDSFVKAVVLRVDSPGGGVVASSEIHAELMKLREAEKRLVVSMGSTAASGGYYVATPAERIYANADTLTGSLGVILSLVNYEEAFAKIGVESVVYKSGELKDIGSPTRPATPEEQEVLQSVVDDAYQGFVDVIAAGRNMPRERVIELADGRIYTGKQALDLGLIDAIGNLDEAIAGAKELAGLTDATVVRYTQPDSLRSLLLSQLSASQDHDPLGVKTLLEQRAPRLEYRWVP
ncbi:signal peptide peptidase SppA [Candidatus Gracilibacteria bacterium]|nr:signal peptide peptidase SppA [Candidatus Gracilibacteria bacterium]